MIAVGKRVYIEELDVVGVVQRVQDIEGEWKVSEVVVQTPTGAEVIQTLQYTVKIASLVSALIPIVKSIYYSIKNWIKGD